MRKFWAFFKIVWQTTLTYRAEQLVWFLIEVLPVFVMVNVWKTMEITGRINSLDASKLITYYVLVLFITRLTSTQFDEWFGDEIKDGRFSFDLIKPKPIKTYLAADQAAKRLSNIVYAIPIFIFLFPSYWPVISSQTDPTKWLVFLFLLIITTVQKFFVSWIVSMGAFWIEQSDSLIHIKWLSEGLLGGAWLPISFFPTWWQAVAKLTPFYSWYSFPAEILINKNITTSDAFIQITISIIWSILLIFISRVLWSKSVNRYSAIGN